EPDGLARPRDPRGTGLDPSATVEQQTDLQRSISLSRRRLLERSPDGLVVELESEVRRRSPEPREVFVEPSVAGAGLEPQALEEPELGPPGRQDPCLRDDLVVFGRRARIPADPAAHALPR